MAQSATRSPAEPAVLSEGARRIVSAAAPLFAAKGFSGVSITDIAAAVGGSKANIFHHFPNKKALYIEAIRFVCQSLRSRLEPVADADRAGGNPLVMLAGRRLQQMFDEPDAVRLILREVFVGEKGIDRSEILHQNFGQFVGELRDEQRAGRVRRDIDPALVAVTILALNNFFFQTWKILARFEEFAGYDTPQACAAAALEILSKGLTKGLTNA
jgi:AcrR family transcriptional regulator